MYYLVNGKKVDPNGKPVEDASPFADFSEAVQKSLAAAGLTAPAQVKGYGKEALVELDSIGSATADKLLAL